MKDKVSNKFDVGIVGLGSTGKKHLQFYLKNT